MVGWLRRMRDLPEDALVLPGHQLPFYGLQKRADELAAHHESRCALIADAARDRLHCSADFVPVLFKRALDPHQMSFAFSEALAHVNYMLREGRLVWDEPNGIVRRVRAV